MAEEEKFFYSLLENTKQVFITSPVYEKYGDAKNWNCAVCETPILKGIGIFLGLNWGGRDINQQTVYPTKKRDEGRDWPFAKHAQVYLNNHFGENIEDLNYSNLCFFRTPDTSFLKAEDWRLAIPLFKEYVDYINPPWIIMLGNPDRLKRGNLILTNEFSVEDTTYKKSVWAGTGILFEKYKFAYVPHSAAWCSSETHNALWKKMYLELQMLFEKEA